MSAQSLRFENDLNTEQVDRCRVTSFAAILRQVLGDHSWSQLESAIATRFSVYVSDNRPLVFHGKMQWVYCSPIGFLISKVIKRFAILPDTCVRDAEFTFNIGMRHGEIFKQRIYELTDDDAFTFTSTFSDAPRLHEEFNGGIGMYLGLLVKRGALLFRDQGYFFRINKWRLRLPRWLTVGHFDLLHRNIDDQRFQIIIRVVHPLLGTLFYQRGEFETRHVN
jgi:hypothetical protein